ncbi:MAG TPA: GFA family protein [Candidatus Binataceae bacterium]|nr:GFA family protein [Candidatus Binataceae bacterium]
MIRGSCLCGKIRYEIDGAIGPALNCHCSMCRKVTGAAFRSRVAVPTKDFRWTAGEDLLSRYESSPGTIRTFCRVCGATLASFFDDNPKTLGLAMGTLDDDPGVRPAFHVFVGSKAPWHEITDALPQFDALPPPSMIRKDGTSGQQ